MVDETGSTVELNEALLREFSSSSRTLGAMVSPQRRTQIVDALRRGTVPEFGLDALAVGLRRFEPAIDEELAKVLVVARGV